MQRTEDAPDDRPQSPDQARADRLLLALSLSLICSEALLFGADHRIWGNSHWRDTSYGYGAFWAGLLYGWRPNYDAQPLLMFVSYSFLHSGISHLAGNLLALWLAGRSLAARTGTWRFLVIWFVATLGGAAVFAVLAPAPGPMVGASGALFGLAGAHLAQALRRRAARGQRRWPVALIVVVAVVGLNGAMALALQGALAWQTHLGGFFAGWIAMALLPDRRRADHSGT